MCHATEILNLMRKTPGPSPVHHHLDIGQDQSNNRSCRRRRTKRDTELKSFLTAVRRDETTVIHIDLTKSSRQTGKSKGPAQPLSPSPPDRRTCHQCSEVLRSLGYFLSISETTVLMTNRSYSPRQSWDFINIMKASMDRNWDWYLVVGGNTVSLQRRKGVGGVVL